MSTYIVNPMFFYWIEVADQVKSFTIAATIISVIAVIIATIMLCVDASMLREFPSLSTGEQIRIPIERKVIKYGIIVFVVSSLIAIFIPSRDTIIYIQIAKLATVDNAELTVDAVKSAVDYIIQSVKEFKVG